MNNNNFLCSVIDGEEAQQLMLEAWGADSAYKYIFLDGKPNDSIYVLQFAYPIPETISGRLDDCSFYIRADTEKELATAKEVWEEKICNPTTWREWAQQITNGDLDCDPFDQSPLCPTNNCVLFMDKFQELWLNKWAICTTMPMGISVIETHETLQRHRIAMCCTDAAQALGFKTEEATCMN